MTNVNTGELLNFQEYSPQHNDRSARIEVEAVHTNSYNSGMSNPNYGFEEPKNNQEEDVPPPCKLILIKPSSAVGTDHS